jgi:hypothetical protein
MCKRLHSSGNLPGHNPRRVAPSRYPNLPRTDDERFSCRAWISMYTLISETAAGVTPGMRLACPRVRGRTCSTFSRISHPAFGQREHSATEFLGRNRDHGGAGGDGVARLPRRSSREFTGIAKAKNRAEIQSNPGLRGKRGWVLSKRASWNKNWAGQLACLGRIVRLRNHDFQQTPTLVPY